MRVCSLLAVTALVGGQIPLLPIEVDREALVAGDKGYLVGLPVHIAGPGVVTSLWSPDGRYLAVKVVSTDPGDRIRAGIGDKVPLKTTFIMWDARTRKSTEMQADVDEEFDFSGWMAGSSALFVVGTKVLPSGPNRDQPVTEMVLLRWKPGEREPRRIRSDNGELFVQPSPILPYALVLGYGEGKGVRYVLEGDNLKPLSLPERSNCQIDTKGYLCFEEITFTQTTPRRIDKRIWRRLYSGGRLELLQGEPDLMDEPQPNPNGLQVLVTTTRPEAGAAKIRVNSSWLWMPDKGKIKTVLVAADSSDVTLSPDLKTVSYVSQGNLMARPISPLTAKDLDGILESAEQQGLLSRAKQLGTAMAIYTTDYYDVFPPNAGWQDLLMPYTKNKELMDGFVYQMNGEDATKVDDPTKKPIGYIQGRYGRAIVYADNHAIWERRRTP